MTFRPDYGETLVSPEDSEALTDEARSLLGDPIRKADLFDLEQAVQNQVADEWWESLLNFDVPLRDLLNDHFVRDLHRRLYAPIWTWGGRQRSVLTNIGVAPSAIAVELRQSLDDLVFRWEHRTLDARTLGIAAHAEVVRIHPFIDGNGRMTRLLADLTFLAAQTGWDEDLLAYSWDLDRPAYIRALRQFDATRDPGPLTQLVPVYSLDAVDLTDP